jgi:hypothetical protein
VQSILVAFVDELQKIFRTKRRPIGIAFVGKLQDFACKTEQNPVNWSFFCSQIPKSEIK